MQPLHGNDTCWAVRKPVTYGLTSYGKLPNASDPLVMMNEIRQRGCAVRPLKWTLMWLRVPSGRLQCSRGWCTWQLCGTLLHTVACE
jgi:hypothetical protein